MRNLVEIQTTTVNTRFMNANKSDDVIDILEDHYGSSELYNGEIDFCEALFSNGFILAMENGLIPVLGTHELAHKRINGGQEYHHFIFEDKCYHIFFTEAE
jgi:hypothetical protein